MGTIFTILFILGSVWVVRLIFEKLGLPFVLGELLAGMIIGPAALGLVGPPGSLFEWTSSMDILAELGMFFIMFYAGLTTDPKELKEKTKAFLGVGILGTIAPLILVFSVTWLFTGNFWISLLIGLALSGTSLATKTRILDDLNILGSKMGQIMMGGGMVDNIFSFIILTVALKAIIQGSVGFLDVIITIFMAFAFFLGVLFLGYYVYPILGVFIGRPGRGFTFALIMGLLIAGLGQLIGFHLIIGAYLAGLFVREEILPPSSPIDELIMGRPLGNLDRQFQTLSHGFLGPIFIVSVAYHVDFAILTTSTLFLIGLIAAAVAGKVIGAGGGALLSGLNKKESIVIGLGMNERGTVELILAAVGLEIGILTETHLSLLVFTAFVTTLMVPTALKYLTFQEDLSEN